MASNFHPARKQRYFGEFDGVLPSTKFRQHYMLRKEVFDVIVDIIDRVLAAGCDVNDYAWACIEHIGGELTYIASFIPDLSPEPDTAEHECLTMVAPPEGRPHMNRALYLSAADRYVSGESLGTLAEELYRLGTSFSRKETFRKELIEQVLNYIGHLDEECGRSIDKRGSKAGRTRSSGMPQPDLLYDLVGMILECERT